MYWCAKPSGRVIEKAKNLPAGHVFLAFLLLLLVHSNLSPNNSPNRSFYSAHDNAEIGADARAPIALEPFAPSFVSDLNQDVVVSSGVMVPLMDEDSFLGQISSEKYWGRKRKKKSHNVSAAQAKKLRAAKIEAATRSGVFTTRRGSGGFFGMFSGFESFLQPNKRKGLSDTIGITAGGYRTLCVRLSDGYYWPLSFATTRGRFKKDSRTCRRSCAEPVQLFVYHNAGGSPEEMVDLKGRRYSDLENAWRYREEYALSRKCSPHPWEEASLAKHRAYAAALTGRAKKHRRRHATRAGKRRLVHVGRLRTMSTVDPDFVDGRNSQSVKRGAKRVVKSQSLDKKRTGLGGAGKVSIKTAANERPRGLVKVDDARKMRLGVQAKRLKPVRAIKRRQVRRAKVTRRPRWASEALGLD